MSKKYFSRLILVFTFIFAMFILMGCKQPQLSFSQKTYEVEVGAEFVLKPDVLNLENAVVKYSVSEEGIVEISGKKVTAIAEGAVTITASLEGHEDVKASVVVVVNPASVQNIEIAGPQKVRVGTSVALVANVTPEYAAEKAVTWKSSDETVAKVDAEGIVTGVAAGEATIMALAKDGSGVVGTYKIEVFSVNLDAKIEILFDKPYVTVGETVNAYAEVEYDGNKELVWSVSGGATISYGNITFPKAGKYVVTAALAAYPEVFETVTFTCYDKATAVNVDIDANLFNIGDTTTLYATVRPSTALDEVEWSTSDPAAATIDENGKLTCLSGGLIKVIATAKDGSGVKGEVTIRIIPYVENITITGKEEMDAYTSQTLTIKMGPEFCTDKYSITSSNPKVATVNEKGVVEALGAGRTTITVTALDGGHFSQTFEIKVIVRANVVICDPELASATEGEVVEYSGVNYIVGQNAFGTITEAIKATSNKVIVLAGEYGDITITEDNVELVGPNANAGKNRATEAVITGKVTIAAGLENVSISGFKFTGQSQVVTTAGEAGKSSATKINLENFKFENNLVESSLTAGKGFLHFVESANSYSKNTQIVNNTFTLVAGSALEAMIYLDNSDSFYVAGNKFVDIAGCGIYQTDTSKGLCGAEPKFLDNEFTNIGKSAIWINWLSPYNGTTGTLNVDGNKFTNIGEFAIYIGKANNSDKYSFMSFCENTFDGAKNYLKLERVTTEYHVIVEGNVFLSEPTEQYIINGKQASANATLVAKYNTYYKDGALTFPDATKFSDMVDFSPMYAPLADITTAADGTEVFVEGVVQYVDAKCFIIRDDLAGVYVYTKDATVKVGDRVQLVGKKTTYSGLVQISDLSSSQVIETGCTISAAMEMTTDAFLALEESSKNVGLKVVLTGELVQNGNYINLKLNDSNTSYLTIADADKDAFTALVGKKVSVTVITYKKSGKYPYNCFALNEGLAPALFVDANLAVEDANNFKTVNAAIAAATPGTVIYVAAGTYDEEVVIDKSVSIIGPNAAVNPNTANRKPEAKFAKDMIIKAGVSDVTLKGICFTAKGRINASEGGNKNLTIDYVVFDSQITRAYADNGCVYVSSALDNGNENLVVTNSRFESTGLRTICMYVEGVKDITVKSNTFIGTPGSFADAIKFGDNYPITGNILIEANEFTEISQYTIWFIPGTGGLLDANVDIIGNTFNKCGDYDANYFRAVVTAATFNVTEGVKTVINFKQNVLTDCYAAIRLQHNQVALSNEQVEVNVNYNIFNSWRSDRLIINSSTGTNQLLTANADYNYYAGGLKDGLLPAAHSSENTYTNASDVPVYVDENFVAPTELKITEKPKTLAAYSEYQVLFSIGPSNASNQKVLFETSNVQVAQVSSTGLITTAGEGTVTITARSAINDELVDSFTFTVVPVSRLEAYVAGNGVIIGNESTTVEVDIYGGADNEKLTFASSDTTIATVNENGVVTGVGEGVVVITITSTSGYSTKVALTVIPEAKYNAYSDAMKVLIENNNAYVINTDLQYIGSDDGSADYWHNIYGSANKYYAAELPKIIENMLPADRANNTNIKMNGGVQFIVVHDTAGSGATSSALNNSNWCTSTSNNSTSWHFTTGNDGIYRQLEDDIIAKHAGDGGGQTYTLEFFDTGIKANGYLPEITLGNDGYFYVAGQKSSVKYPQGAKSIVPEGLNCVIGENGNYFMPTTHVNGSGQVCIKGGNSNGIGIESCVNAGSDVYLTWQYTAKLVAQLLVKHNLLPDRMTYHNNFSGKLCPRTMMTAGLTGYFREMVYAEYEIAKNFSDYEIKFESSNPAILDNTGRIVKAPEYSTNVAYTISVTKGGVTETVTLNVYVPGQYNINTLS